MIRANDFLSGASEVLGIRQYTGVPCSFLTPLINRVIDNRTLSWICSTNEGDAVATAAGAAIGGKPALALMQNSGLGNAVNALSSLTWVFRLPLLLLVTQRGKPGLRDEPQHALMGRITPRLLELLDIPAAPFPEHAKDILPSLERAREQLRNEQRPYAYIVPRGGLEDDTHSARPARSGPGGPDGPDNGREQDAAPISAPGAGRAARTAPERGRRKNAAGKAGKTGREEWPGRSEALERIIALSPEQETLLIAGTGYTGRALHALADRPNHFYMVGSMGHTASLGLGLALALPARHIIVVEGDGAILMRMGNLAALGHYGGGNLSHVILDNEVHDSTGAQATVSPTVQFADVALACGYRSARAASSLDALSEVLGPGRGPGPRLVHLKIRPGAPSPLPRPRHGPEQVLRRLMQHIGARFPE